MTNDTAGDPLDIEGPAAPPRSNGELVFTAPWQSRLFAATMRLHQSDRIEWETFRQGLISEISAHEASLVDQADYDYWACWQRALERLLDGLRVVSNTELDATAQALATRPAGHDHDHAHDQGHDHGHGQHADHEH